MNAYGAAAMNQLFTVYAQQNASMAAPVTTANGTLDWTYVASGLTAGSGVAGQLANGMYFVQLDSAGGGVETVLPGDANLDGQVDVNDLTIVLSHFGQTGMSWAQGEFTGDGTVDVNDLTIVLSHFGQTLGLPAADAAAVPEPACAVSSRHRRRHLARVRKAKASLIDPNRREHIRAIPFGWLFSFISTASPLRSMPP